jgi:hypothetical protein
MYFQVRLNAGNSWSTQETISISCRTPLYKPWCYLCDHHSSFFLLWVGWDLRHQVLWPLLAYCTAPNGRWGWLWSNWWNEDWQGKLKYSEKTCPSVTLSTTDPTWPDPCANPGRRGGKPATNRLSYGAAIIHHWQNSPSWAIVYLRRFCQICPFPIYVSWIIPFGS